jgi:DNA-binding SARP family transcriptional activator
VRCQIGSAIRACIDAPARLNSLASAPPTNCDQTILPADTNFAHCANELLTLIDFSRGYNLQESAPGTASSSARDGFWGPSVLSVSLLGVSRVASVNERIWADLGPAGRRLAGFLFTYPDRPHRRDRLIDLFWPDYDGERGRRAMNSAVWRLRKLLASSPQYREGHSLRTVGTETILERTSWLDVDTWALLGIAASLQNEAANEFAVADCKNNLTVLYRYEGPFLDGEDADWILEERERLHSLFIQSAMTVVRQLGRREYYNDAILLARHALKFDPYREELVRTLLILLALDERRSEALRYYDHWSALLHKELGISPLSATRSLIQEILELHNSDNVQHLGIRLAGRSDGRRHAAL